MSNLLFLYDKGLFCSVLRRLSEPSLLTFRRPAFAYANACKKHP
jgi:hypothetical protein